MFQTYDEGWAIGKLIGSFICLIGNMVECDSVGIP